MGMIQRAALFDLDGLLVDTEPHWEQAETEVFADLGVQLSSEQCRAVRGLSIADVVELRIRSFGITGRSKHDLVQLILDRVLEGITQHGRLLPGALEVLDELRTLSWRTAIATSSPRRFLEGVVDRFGLRKSFDHLQSAEQVEHGKPHPAVFLAAARALGVAPAACVVFEDAILGVVAAKAARMSCVAVPCAEQRDDPRFALADLVLGGLDEWNAATLARLTIDLP